MNGENSLKEQCVLVTGASSGIGRAVAVSLSECGMRVILVARNEAAMYDTVDMMHGADSHIVIPFDLCDLDNYCTIFGILQEKGVKLTGLVHCAGISRITPLRTFTYGNAMELFNIHYFAFMELVKWYAKKNISDGGSIVGISSINVHTPQKCMTAYASAKAAMEAACRSLSVELAEKNIRINSVVVGGVATEMGRETRETLKGINSSYQNPVSRQLLGTGTPEQIATVVRFLLGEEASFITGREIYADGGLF